MKGTALLVLYGVIALCIANTWAGCGDDTNKNSDDGEVKAWFKTLGCKITQQTSELGEQIAQGANKLAASAAQTYEGLKQKLSDDNKPADGTATTPFTPHHDAPTEKVPLAPLSSGSDRSVENALNPSLAPLPAAGSPATGEQRDDPEVTPSSIDDRFLFQPRECPAGHTLDHKNQCRPNNR